MSTTNEGPPERRRDAYVEHSIKPTFARYIACYALYVVVLAGCLANLLLWKSAVEWTATAIIGTEISLEAGYAFPMVIIICVLFGVAIWTEHLLRTSVPRGELRRVFARIAIRLIVAGLVAIVITTVVIRLLQT